MSLESCRGIGDTESMENSRLRSKKVRVCIVQTADPCGSIPGGIDTFIRGEINNAPDDIEYSVVGITTDNDARPVGQWTRCNLHGRSFSFFPVTDHQPGDKKPIIPSVVKFLMRLGSVVDGIDADVLEFHRVETILRFWSDSRPKTAVMHQNMQSLYDKRSGVRWSSVPSLYFRLEDKLVPKLRSAFCVSQDAVDYYQSRFANLASSFRFQPTWADPKQFSPPTAMQKRESRERLASDFGLDADSQWLVAVGRLVREKNPLLLVDSIRKLVEHGKDQISVLIVGDGPLRGETIDAVHQAGLSNTIRFLGSKGIDEVAQVLQAADLFVLSSANEGMPMAVIEALASGVPVATTRVGEVGRLVHDGTCGRIAEDHTEEKFADAIEWCLDNLPSISGAPCVESASRFRPAAVLEPVYENYRQLASLNAVGNSVPERP